MKISLVPPKLGGSIVQKVVCTRPTRQGCFRLVKERKGEKEIINCTGHGGAGWTTLFGYIERAISLIEKKRPIRIVGAGCMGLTAAVELQRRGFSVAGITTKNLWDSASWRAAGYFALIKIEATAEEQKAAYEMGIETFQTFGRIVQGNHPYLSRECARFLPVYCSQKMVTGVEKLEEMDLLPPKRIVTLDFDGVQHPDFFETHTYFINTSLIMQELLEEVKKRGIVIDIAHLNSFNDVEEEVIMNCSGMGAKQLGPDLDMVGVRGHLLMINDLSDPSHRNYMIYTTVLQEEKEEYLYMFPKNFSVTADNPQGLVTTATLGGTFIPGVDELPLDEQNLLDAQEFEKIIARHERFFYGKRF